MELETCIKILQECHILSTFGEISFRIKMYRPGVDNYLKFLEKHGLIHLIKSSNKRIRGQYATTDKGWELVKIFKTLEMPEVK